MCELILLPSLTQGFSLLPAGKESYGDLKSALEKEPASHKHVHMSIGMSIADQSVSPSIMDTNLLHTEVPETSTGIAKVCVN